jgi:hypothetical protein
MSLYPCEIDVVVDFDFSGGTAVSRRRASTFVATEFAMSSTSLSIGSERFPVSKFSRQKNENSEKMTTRKSFLL